jgi:hypothetical protein
MGRDARDLIDEAELAAVRATIQTNNPGMSKSVADRIVVEALAFVATCANSTARGLRPSRIVDEGWHALILHTRVYAGLCGGLGRTVHHVPEAPDTTRYAPGALDATQDVMRAAGYEPDPMLWLPPTDDTIPVAASCQHGPGEPEGTCTGDPDGDGPSGPN